MPDATGATRNPRAHLNADRMAAACVRVQRTSDSFRRVESFREARWDSLGLEEPRRTRLDVGSQMRISQGVSRIKNPLNGNLAAWGNAWMLGYRECLPLDDSRILREAEKQRERKEYAIRALLCNLGKEYGIRFGMYNLAQR
jgi:hypothetical protein